MEASGPVSLIGSPRRLGEVSQVGPGVLVLLIRDPEAADGERESSGLQHHHDAGPVWAPVPRRDGPLYGPLHEAPGDADAPKCSQMRRMTLRARARNAADLGRRWRARRDSNPQPSDP